MTKALPPPELPILRTARVPVKVDLARAFLAASGQPGQTGWRVFRRILRCRTGAQSITPLEFFRYGLHRPGLTDADCAAYLSDVAVTRFNTLLNGPADQNDTARLCDKLVTGQILTAAGLPTAATRAVYRAEPDPGDLRTAADIAAFLLAPGHTPCFGKPVFGSLSMGVVSVEQALDAGHVLLGNGRSVAASALAAEIVAHYPAGYVFQDVLRAGPGVRHLSGPVLPSIRICSLWLQGGPVPLYAAMRLPAAGAMSDDGGSGRNARLHIDVQTGAVIRGQDMHRFSGVDLAKTPVTDVPLAGQAIPDWATILALACDAHRQFPRHCCIGTDIAPSDQGFVINEVNANPLHMTYQVVSKRGILNDTFRPLFRAALAERGIVRAKSGVPWP